MKKILSLFLGTILPITGILSQISFSVYPNPSVTTGTASDFEMVAMARIKNLTTTDIPVKWSRTVILLDSSMQTAFADCYISYAPFVSEKNMVLPASDSCGFNLYFFNPEMIDPPPGIVQVKVTNLNNPADTLTAVYLLNPALVSGIPFPLQRVELHPNPVTDFFQLTGAGAVGGIQIYSLNGEFVLHLKATPSQRYPSTFLQNGLYLLALEDAEGRVFQVLEMVKGD